MSVKVIHAGDQFLQNVRSRPFALQHSTDPDYGDYWSTTIEIKESDAHGTRWGQPGRYMYRYCVTVDGKVIDYISDPFAREFSVGAMSAFTLGYQPYTWSDGEAQWKTPDLRDLVMYEIMIAEFAGDLRGATSRIPYLADLGINCIEVMPVSNSGVRVDWGFLPTGYFGVDERFGTRADMHRFVDEAHQHDIAVVLDAVFGHTGDRFPYYHLYRKLSIPNPFIGKFAREMWGRPTNWDQKLTRDFFLTVSHFWLDRFHVDGFRYDCVPEYLVPEEDRGFKLLVKETYKLVKAKTSGHWTRFWSVDGKFNLITCAEDVEHPREILKDTYCNCTWQNETLAAARETVDNRQAVTDFGHKIGLLTFPVNAVHDGEHIEKTALQYIENHDHSRFICRFGLVTVDRNELFVEGDRRNSARLQPYLIALLTAKGIPFLWQGQEFCENYSLPESGVGRPYHLRPVRWEYVYDRYGNAVLDLVRRLLHIRKERVELRRGDHLQWVEKVYQERGVMIFSRGEAPDLTIVTVNFSKKDATVRFAFPPGHWIDRLSAGHAQEVLAGETDDEITIPKNYGQVWCLVSES